MMTITHRDARAIVNEAFRRAFAREPGRAEAQCVQAVGWLETGYGQSWKPPGDGSNNWGAIQKGGWTGPVFSYTDTRPNEDGTSTPYRIDFRKYVTPVDGATDLCWRVLTGGMPPGREKAVAPFAKSGDTLGFSSGLYDTVYYQGFGRTREERIGHHHKAVVNACAAMARELREPMPDGSDPPRVVRVLRLGSTGKPVAIVQRIVGAGVDGVFGPSTKEALKAWQRHHNLKPDGVWGPVCYGIVEKELSGETLDALDGLEDSNA
jgi:peptidoglycan hydrolase-like protein with peptidoglycan-binding domain